MDQPSMQCSGPTLSCPFSGQQVKMSPFPYDFSYGKVFFSMGDKD